ncbi:hypothetical protein [Agrobacterium tumefaciens]|uniref:hypothetical protein n=1 Tax=Agrobacterium tumefaciens TaxID=358 RepID=UPI000DD0B0E6|nr:hypothetical protein [Agrobacterium tumefaciens]MDP9791385.1 thioredoxin-related protein [Agrobacterium tumefaciens]
MKLFLAAFAFTAFCASTTLAQTRDETLKIIGDATVTLNEVNKAMMASENSSVAADLFKDALKKVSDLQDQLKDNPYVRLSSFRVNVPWGISIEFTLVVN